MFSSNIFIVLLLTIRAAIHLIILLSELGELGELGSRSSFSHLSIKWDICKNTYHLSALVVQMVKNPPAVQET